MIEPIAAAALAIEGAVGWPARLHAITGHPVGLFARLIRTCERHLNRSDRSPAQRRMAGAIATGLLVIVTGGVTFAIEATVRATAGSWAWPILALLAWPAIAARSLDDHVRPIRNALLDGDLPEARRTVGMIVGRDTQRLDAPATARAAIESLAESFCDGVVAPLFWLLVLGLPGAWMLKAINTADSMIGHREEPYGPYGWAAARLDDLVMLIPARLAGVLLCLAASGGWRIMARDHARHASPNAGWPEAAMAGALGVRLAGPIAYDGVLADKPWIGDGADAAPRHLSSALSIYRRACLILGIIAMGAAWLV
ncbi:adenosylcobinamide-phosphate synthase CbiB [Novosphingobium guangzhouense]|uniref:Cobalamin biosynthesis protein CobD n=1 Tax=Novosphingobium guangzhouense TaxID=1850347 RepID=A0A2K2FVA0_9SPHN|nr:adenosylcobinamide-phosphate synthase CbiB [Novosphingobium guangzhouense]PNU02688.1 cobalamin biosynthesis protein CobD [Novosphingobium guangzhouense]